MVRCQTGGYNVLNRFTFPLIAILLVLSSIAYANTTPSADCTSFPVTFTNGTGGPTGVSCPAFSVAGGTLTGVALSYSADYQFGATSGTNMVQVTFVPAGPAGVTWNPASQMLTVSGGASSGTEPTGGSSATAGITNSAFSAAFTVNISSSVTSGTVATSAGAVSIVYTYTPPPAITLACPTSTGMVGTPYSSALVASGGVPPYTFSIISGSLPPVLMLNTSTGAITGTPTTAGPFSFTGQVVDSTGTSAGTTTANCTITIANIPPPPTTGCNPATVIFSTGGPADAFQVRYTANLNIGDSVVNVSNSGANGATASGNICVNVYGFDPGEELLSCCSCLVTPDALASFSVKQSIVNNTLIPTVPTSVVIKLVASVPNTGALASGMLAWGTSLHSVPTPVGAYGTTETPFVMSTLSSSELTRITAACGFNQTDGSGFGLCAGCPSAGLGAAAIQ